MSARTVIISLTDSGTQAFVDGVVEGLMRVGMVALHAMQRNPVFRATLLVDKMLSDAPLLWRHIWDHRKLIPPRTRSEHQYPKEIVPGKKDYSDPLTLLAIQYQQLYSAKLVLQAHAG